MLLTTDGRVFSWGDDSSPCLGVGKGEDEKGSINERDDESGSGGGSNFGDEEEGKVDNELHEV